MTREIPVRRPVDFAAITCLVLWWSVILPARGVVDANSATNTAVPPEAAPWANVGSVNYSSGIYLGGGWGLTAGHVGPGNIELDGFVYPYDGQFQGLTNADGSSTDLVMFHLSAAPNLPRLALASRRPAAGSEVVLIGYGRIAGSAQTTLGIHTGFYWSGGGYKSWGNNHVNAGGLTTITLPLGRVTAFSTDFTAPGVAQSSHEGQAAQGDSGGAVFQLSGQTWQLAGVINAISTLPNQPAESAAYGNSTYAADMATYAGQIEAIMASTPPGMTISRSGNNVQVCWPDTGITYKLEAAAGLATSAWSTITPNLTLNNGQYCAVLPAGGNTRFFRLSNAPPEP